MRLQFTTKNRIMTCPRAVIDAVRPAAHSSARLPTACDEMLTLNFLPTFSKPLLLGLGSSVLVSCAYWKSKPTTLEEVPVESPATTELVEAPPLDLVPPTEIEPAPPFQDDGLRLPADDLTQLPSDRDFNQPPIGARPGTSGAVIARPPTEPPVRVKPDQE